MRGAALLGILVMNIMLFAMPEAAYNNPFALGDRGRADFLIWLFSHLFFDQKFMTLFSMLFGAGIVLLATRVEQRGGRPAVTHYRRMLALLVFGLIHAYLIWEGDILVTYAVAGAVIYPLRRLRPRVLITIGVVFLLVGSSILVAGGTYLPRAGPEATEEFQSMWAPSAEQLRVELAAHRGVWMSAFHWRLQDAMGVSDILLWGLWRAGGNMLIGMALLKLHLLTGDRPAAFNRTMALAGFAIGLPVIAFGAYQMHTHAWETLYSFFFAGLYNYWASIVVAFGWLGALLLWWQSGVLTGVKSRIIAVGRTAFSCYVLTSILCTLFFNGYGLGFFDRVGRPGQLIVTIVVWTILLTVAPAWLKRFDQGPLEWLWRVMYGGRASTARASSVLRN